MHIGILFFAEQPFYVCMSKKKLKMPNNGKNVVKETTSYITNGNLTQ